MSGNTLGVISWQNRKSSTIVASFVHDSGSRWVPSRTVSSVDRVGPTNPFKRSTARPGSGFPVHPLLRRKVLILFTCLFLLSYRRRPGSLTPLHSLPRPYPQTQGRYPVTRPVPGSGSATTPPFPPSSESDWDSPISRLPVTHGSSRVCVCGPNPSFGVDDLLVYNPRGSRPVVVSFPETSVSGSLNPFCPRLQHSPKPRIGLNGHQDGRDSEYREGGLNLWVWVLEDEFLVVTRTRVRRK